MKHTAFVIFEVLLVLMVAQSCLRMVAGGLYWLFGSSSKGKGHTYER